MSATAIPDTSTSSMIENAILQRVAAARNLWTSSASLLRDEAKPARTYLAGRGLDAQAIHGLDVMHVHRWPSPRVGPTIAFAFRDQRGEIVAVQGRACVTNVICSHVAVGAKKAGVYTTTSLLDTKPIGIVEAPLDALSLSVAGLEAVATGGTTFPSWLPRALRMSRRIIVAADADAAGDRFARALCDALLGAAINPSRIVRFRPDRAKDANAELIADPDHFCADVRRARGAQD